jgi:hypothetical protein
MYGCGVLLGSVFFLRVLQRLPIWIYTTGFALHRRTYDEAIKAVKIIKENKVDKKIRFFLLLLFHYGRKAIKP